jgi:RNA recognition motif-containing protein
MNIYVGNLTSATTEDDLKEAFGAFGNVNSAKIINDYETGMSRGFGFVDMAQNAGKQAIETLNGSDLNGNSIIVNEAYERERRGGGGNRGGFNGGNRGGNRGGGRF